jgi:transposase-like protein
VGEVTKEGKQSDMATKKKTKSRRRYSDETKAEAVGALNAGTPGARLQKRFGVAVAQIYVWRKAGFGKGSAQKTVSADLGLALSLDETVRLIVRDEIAKLKAARG